MSQGVVQPLTIQLAGTGETMISLLGVDSPTFSIETITGQRIVLRKVP